MELIEYDKVLTKALANIIDVGIRKQYFKSEDRLRLTKKLAETLVSTRNKTLDAIHI